MLPRLSKTPFALICPTDPAVDAEGSDFVRYRETGDVAHLAIKDDATPITFMLRALDSVEFEDVLDETDALEGAKKNRAQCRLAFERGLVSVSGWSEDGADIDTRDGVPDEIQRAIPHDWLQHMGQVVLDRSKSEHTDPLFEVYLSHAERAHALAVLVGAIDEIPKVLFEEGSDAEQALTHARRLLGLEVPHQKTATPGKS